jgi:hypothetical protein
MTKARKTNPPKRRPKKERVITKAMKASFDAEHAKAMRALANHDFSTVNQAIARERELIERQKARIFKKQSKLTKP